MQNNNLSGIWGTNNRSHTNTTEMFSSRLTERILLPPLMIISLYLAICTVIYQARKHRSDMKWTNRLCTMAGTSPFLMTLGFPIDIFANGVSDILCNFQFIWANFFYLLNRLIVFQVLWLRQKTLYDGTGFIYSTAQLKVIKFFQYLVVLINFVTFVMSVYVGFFSLKKLTSKGCVNVDPISRATIAVIVGPFTVGQIILLILILVPLINHIRSVSKAGNSTTRAEQFVIRIGVFTGLCVGTDILFLLASGAGSGLLGSSASIMFFPLLNSYNLLLNTGCMLLSFRDYRERLWPGKPKVQPSC